MKHHRLGPMMTVASAAFFGVSPVLIKLTLGELHSIFLAALLYWGSSAGLISY
jgi:hypothetical protein